MAAGRTLSSVDGVVSRVLRQHLDEPHWFVAFSGGLDSTALLLALNRYVTAAENPPTLTALHIHHGLSAQADDWEAHCVLICKKLHISCAAQRISVVSDGQGMEAAARGARYAVFENALRGGGSLFLGHHQDDQVETFFLRLMRGAGARGLTGMPEERPLGRGRLVRPLLTLTREVLQAYVVAAGLNWIEDSSNDDTRYDRNYLRQRVLPLLERRWPGYRAPVTRAMALLAEQEASGPPAALPTRHNDFGDPGCDSELLCRLSPQAAASALRRWLRGQGCQLPDREPLLEFLRQLRSAAADAAPRLRRRDWCLQRHAGAVYLLPRPWPFVQPSPRAVSDGDCITLEGVGQIAISVTRAAESALTLGFRRGGERLRLPGETHHRALKTLLQDAGVPPWWRERVPLLFCGQELIAVGDLWQAAGARASLAWKRPLGSHPD
ncbi:MAG: tRNA lysidine(34) synthetase TilS [Chromatocurvus sp.]